MEKTLRFHEHGPVGQTYIMRYTAGEMAELFTEEQRAMLAKGECIIFGKGRRSSVVDLEAFFIANNRIGFTK